LLSLALAFPIAKIMPTAQDSKAAPPPAPKISIALIYFFLHKLLQIIENTTTPHVKMT